ncbi:uncharacterized protein LOC130669981 [Microplitis mediator]|uniref:uncharacterized protein LOC130669981 n=1 Tax=Microplitis mediator TaxID=375433 RepID=UPI0025520EC2|nr:uncharacterized protein LOC130669981 [Microplitis mediator]
MSDAQFRLPSFTLFRNDRANRSGGGVALYIRSSLSTKVVLCSTYIQNHPEYLLMEVWLSSRQKILVGVVYNPPLSDSLSILESDLDDVMPHYNHVILLGDFNINMNVVSPKSDGFMEFCGCLGMDLLNFKDTHHNANSHSWIDHCLVSNLDFVLSSRQSSEPFLADHDLISLQYDYKVPISNRNKFWCRNWSRIDDDYLQQLCSSLDLSYLIDSESVDTMNIYLHEHIRDVVEEVAPLREINVREKPAPWINSDIKTLQRRRSRLYRIFIRSGFAFKEYVNLRKVIKTRIMKAKQNYFDQRFRDRTNAKSFWNDLRKLGLVKGSDSTVNPNIDLEELNNYFVNAAGDPLDLIDYEYLDRVVPKYHSSFTFKSINCNIVKEAIMRIASSSMGPDGCFPSAWKRSYVVPLPKVHSPTNYSDYRPISLTWMAARSFDFMAN